MTYFVLADFQKTLIQKNEKVKMPFSDIGKRANIKTVNIHRNSALIWPTLRQCHYAAQSRLLKKKHSHCPNEVYKGQECIVSEAGAVVFLSRRCHRCVLVPPVEVLASLPAHTSLHLRPWTGEFFQFVNVDWLALQRLNARWAWIGGGAGRTAATAATGCGGPSSVRIGVGLPARHGDVTVLWPATGWLTPSTQLHHSFADHDPTSIDVIDDSLKHSATARIQTKFSTSF